MTLDTTVTQLVLRAKNYALARQLSRFNICMSIEHIDVIKVGVRVRLKEVED